MSRPPSFDGIARPYRWLEYLTLGLALVGARTRFLDRLAGRREGLVLGDGDGRFLARLLRHAPRLHATAVDTSPAMLALLRGRCAPFASRLDTACESALTVALPAVPVDLVVTHFFLDCLSQAEVELLVGRIVPGLASEALWVVSEFRVPAGPMHYPARGSVRALYWIFGIVTGLRTTHLPDYACVLAAAGFDRIGVDLSLFGMLTAELWQRSSPASEETKLTGGASTEI